MARRRHFFCFHSRSGIGQRWIAGRSAIPRIVGIDVGSARGCEPDGSHQRGDRARRLALVEMIAESC
jgi:hypothetical protein